MMFVHALIRDGAYASLLHSSRRSLHLRAADWYAGRDAPLHAEHLDRADEPGAAAAYLVAAQAEAAALRIDAALRLVRRGAELDAPLPVRHALAEQEGNLCSDLGDAPGDRGLRARVVAGRGRCATLRRVDGHRRRVSRDQQGGTRVRGAGPCAGTGAADGRERDLARIHYLRGSLHFARGDGHACRSEHDGRWRSRSARAIRSARRRR